MKIIKTSNYKKLGLKLANDSTEYILKQNGKGYHYNKQEGNYYDEGGQQVYPCSKCKKLKQQFEWGEDSNGDFCNDCYNKMFPWDAQEYGQFYDPMDHRNDPDPWGDDLGGW